MGVNLDELRHLRRARDVIERDYAAPLRIADLAKIAHMSPAHFIRRFQAAYAQTPHSYLVSRRIERAQALLRSGESSVTQACFAVGYSSLGSFSATFTQIVGQTPTAYAAQDHSALAALAPCHAMVVTRPHRTACTSSSF